MDKSILTIKDKLESLRGELNKCYAQCIDSNDEENSKILSLSKELDILIVEYIKSQQCTLTKR